MMNMADGRPDWPTIYRILTQRDFEPKRLMLESNVCGFTRPSARKRAFIDIMVMACINFKSAATGTRVPIWNDGVGKYGNCYISYADWYKNLQAFILETTYFDKWLVAYRLTSMEKFNDFCMYALRTWSKGSQYRYELEYDPNEWPDSRKVAWEDFARDIINKAKKLLGKAACDGNK